MTSVDGLVYSSEVKLILAKLKRVLDSEQSD